jgi:hypothetical protein
MVVLSFAQTVGPAREQIAVAVDVKDKGRVRLEQRAHKNSRRQGPAEPVFGQVQLGEAGHGPDRGGGRPVQPAPALIQGGKER